MSKHRIIRPFPAAMPLKTGMVVDTTDWRPRNRERLVRMRYIEPVSDETPLTLEEQSAAPGTIEHPTAPGTIEHPAAGAGSGIELAGGPSAAQPALTDNKVEASGVQRQPRGRQGR